MSRNITTLASTAFLGGVLGRIFEYSLSVLIARALGADGLGAFAFGFVILQFGGAIARVGLDTAMQKFVPMYADDERRLTGTTLAGYLTAFVAGTVLAGALYLLRTVEPLASTAIAGPAGLFLIGIPLFAMYRVGEAATRGFKETKYSVYIRSLGQTGAALVFVAIAVTLFEGIAAVAVAYLASLVVALLLSLVFLYRLGAFDGLSAPAVEYRRLYSYSVPVMASAIAYTLVFWSDILMLGRLVPTTAVGHYQAAYRTSEFVGFVLLAVNRIFPALASELYDDGELERLQSVYSVLTKWIAVLTLLIATFEIMFASELLQLFGSSFVRANVLLGLLVVGQFVAAAAGPTGYLLSMADHERLELANTVALAAINLALNYVLILRFGVLGAAVATATSISLLNAVRLVEIRVLLGFWPYSRRHAVWLLPLGAAVGSMVAVRTLSLGQGVTLALGGLLSVAVFTVAARATAISEEDRLLVESI